MEEAATAAANLRHEISEVEGREICAPQEQSCACVDLAPLDVSTCGGCPVGAARHIAYPCALPSHARIAGGGRGAGG